MSKPDVRFQPNLERTDLGYVLGQWRAALKQYKGCHHGSRSSRSGYRRFTVQDLRGNDR